MFSSSCFVIGRLLTHILGFNTLNTQTCAPEFSNFFAEFSAVTTDHIFIDTF